MEKHGVTEQDLNDEAVSTFEFKFRNARERILLSQVLYKVFDSTGWTSYSYTKRGRKVSNTVGVDCTKAQKIEVNFLYDFYKRLYKKEEDLFFTAFVNKHNLFGSKPTGGKSKELSREEARRLAQMMNGMDDATPHKQIEERSEKQ